jgi:hypothetical protein
MEVEVGKILLKKIPHEGKEINFLYPAFRGNYGEVSGKIDKAGLKRPYSPEIASLIDNAWKNPRGEYESKILDILTENWLWEYTGNLYLPKSNEEINNGVILEYNPKIVTGKLSMDKNSLIERLRENDPLVKFVPFGYKISGQTPGELEINPYIIARYGEEGAENIAAIASRYDSNPHLYSFICVDEEKAMMSGMDNTFDHSRLIIGGNIINFLSYGHSFGRYPD